MNEINQKLTVAIEESGQRLDKFLLSKFPSHSRSKIQKIIEENVTVNGKKTKNSQKIKKGDEIEIYIEERKEFVLEPNPDIAVPVIFENNDYLIINKPAGLVVHPGEGHLKQDTLANWLIAKYPEIISVGPIPNQRFGRAVPPPQAGAEIGHDSLRPGIVHRLDKETSGIMIIAKTNEFYEFIREQFDGRKVKKTYLAWVKGEVKLSKGRISKPIKRGRAGFKLAAQENGRDAITNYKILKRGKEKTLLEIKPLTGRMHQIRVHASSIGHPVIGDSLYGKDKTGPYSESKIRTGRLAKGENRPLLLHAWKIQFKDTSGELMEFEAKIPAYFEN